ncbi:MAG: glycosyltransferase family 4 protein [Saccharofermentanales bacterium]
MYRLGRKVLKQYDYKACIYAYEVNGVIAGKKLARRYSLPFITRFQGTVLAPVKNTLLNRLRKYPHFQALRTKADVTIMTDDGTQGDTVLRNLHNQSETVKFWRNGVDIRADICIDAEEVAKIRSDLGIRDADKILLTVSRLAAWKKVNRALEALAVAVHDNPDLKLVVVGDGDEKQNLIDQAKEIGIENNVIFTGAVKQDKIKHYFGLADIFLSLYDLSNVGNPLLEAMSCGKPIITLDVGDTAELIKNDENGILLDVNRLDEIPVQIHRILKDRDFAIKIGENARKYARDNFWSWEDRMNEEADVVNRLYAAWEFCAADKNEGKRRK